MLVASISCDESKNRAGAARPDYIKTINTKFIYSFMYTVYVQY